MADLWFDLSATTQDAIVLCALTIGPLTVATLALVKYRLGATTFAMLRHHWQANIAMIALIAIATSINLLTTLQSSSLMTGSARASDPFDLIVAAPGNDIDVLLSVIYLQSDALTLLDASVLQRLQQHESVLFAAPVGFGDSLGGYPLIGTTADMLSHLAGSSRTPSTVSDTRNASQTWFPTRWSVVPGASTRLIPGTRLHAEHGDVNMDEPVEHLSHMFDVQPSLPVTGTPWDHASLVSISALWALHGLGEHDETTFTLDTPQVPAVIVKARTTGELYSLRQEFNTSNSMAFFPAEVLSRLYGVMTSATTVLHWITLSTQLLVISAVLLCSFMLMRSLSERFRMLHAIGAPYAYRFYLIWLFIAVLIVLGVLLGLVAGWLLALGAAQTLSHALSIPLLPQPALNDFISTGVLLLLTLVLAVVPAWLLLRR